MTQVNSELDYKWLYLLNSSYFINNQCLKLTKLTYYGEYLHSFLILQGNKLYLSIATVLNPNIFFFEKETFGQL